MMRHPVRVVVRLVLAMVAATMPLAAQEAGAPPAATTAPAATAVATPAAAEQATPDDAKAIEFLDRVERKHAETKSLKARFEQVRIDENFLEEVRSNGEFMYKAPSRFRANYQARGKGIADSTVFIVDDKMWHYVPEIKQVDVVNLPKGDSAAVNQILLGFGVKRAQVVRFFRVDFAPGAPPAGKTVLTFTSKDRQRTLNFSRITITFDSESLLAEKLLLEDAESKTTISLSEVEMNPKLDDSVFATRFPKDVEVVERETTGP